MRSVFQCKLPVLALAAAAALCSALPASAANFSALYVFGDSLSDGGNNFLTFGGLTGPAPSSNTFIPSLPYAPSAGFTNRPDYSNGPSWVGAFATGLGLGSYATPSLLPGGGNYAYGGARMTVDGSGVPPFIPAPFPASVKTQLTTYLTSGPAVSPTALYVIAGGGNDVRDVGAQVAAGAPLVPTTTAAAAAYAAAAAQMVSSLRTAGATNIVVWNVPDVGKTPASGAGVGATAAGASFIASAFNTALSTALAGSGAQIFDVYGLIDTIVASPATYGFGNVTQACGFAGNGCDASTALFWDGIHPTAFAHSFVANAMLAAVPEPATSLMLALGIVAMIGLRRRA